MLALLQRQYKSPMTGRTESKRPLIRGCRVHQGFNYCDAVIAATLGHSPVLFGRAIGKFTSRDSSPVAVVERVSITRRFEPSQA